MEVNWLLLIFGILVAVAYFSFIGGVAGAIVGGGREDRSLAANAGIGLLGAIVGGAVWASISGGEFDLGVANLVAALVGSIVVLMVWTFIQRGKSGPVAG